MEKKVHVLHCVHIYFFKRCKNLFGLSQQTRMLFTCWKLDRFSIGWWDNVRHYVKELCSIYLVFAYAYRLLYQDTPILFIWFIELGLQTRNDILCYLVKKIIFTVPGITVKRFELLTLIRQEAQGPHRSHEKQVP